MSIYREYDIRGIFEKELNEDTVKKIGYTLGLKVEGEYVSIGYDARTHSPKLFEWLCSGFVHAGKKVINIQLVPTPVNYFTNYQELRLDNAKTVTPSASVMITGSHNPPEYNGFKITLAKAPFFGEDIYALGREISSLVEIIPDSDTYVEFDASSMYIDYIVNEFEHLRGMDLNIVYDCGNGVAGSVLPAIIERLNLKAKGIFIEPDGTFPNHHPDPSEEENLEDIKLLLHREGDIAFAYDGDADRIAVLTKKHNIKGDIMALLLSKQMTNPTVIGEVKCSQVMYDTIRERGGTAIMYKTGHSNLKVKIRETNADLAAEVSGHIFFNDRYFGYDDAIYTTFRVLELVNRGMDLDAEVEALPVVFSTQEIKIKTTEEEKFKIIDILKTKLQAPPLDFPDIKEIIDVDGVRVIFENGWGLVRASNTTPVLVTRFESQDLKDAQLYEKHLNALIESSRQALK
ncbi:phosphomannomutase/phosphoglucomutase [Sulfurimonas sp. MAG313]|nr:phosphomannomutase/phosphoglucomutase [Sulfurimonas sp. MAG313]MDF1880154.1 phosphomannomutase/phosphoglucomutase [Sulfurimonas sp. MAG313]